jgi:putative transposase
MQGGTIFQVSDYTPRITRLKFTGEWAERPIAASMDGQGRCMDNIFVERLWRSLKYPDL